MTKTLTLDVTSFKFADNDTDLKFRAMQNGVIISDSTLSATIKIKQVDVGYLKSVSAKWVDKRIVISSGDLSDLPVGSYLLELWLGSPSGYEIFPDSGFVNLYINQNATGFSGNLISSITLAEFQQHFSDLAKEVNNNIELKANSSDMTSLQNAMNSLQSKVEAFGITPENLVTIKSLLDAIANSASDSEIAEIINSINILTNNISLMSGGDYSLKANKSDLESLQATINNQSATISSKANKTDLDNLQTTVTSQGVAISTKAEQADLLITNQNVTTAQTTANQAETELIESRNGKSNLKTRIDDLENETTAQLAEIVTREQYISVKEFGAKGDGATNDTKAIQDAIDFAIMNGKNILINEGVYNVTTLKIKSKTKIRGIETNKTTIKGTTDSNIFELLDNNVNNFTIERLTIDGNNVSKNCIHIEKTSKQSIPVYPILRNLYLKNAKESGIYIGSFIVGSLLENIKSQANNYGIRLNNTTDNIFINCEVFHNKICGIYGTTFSSKFTNCKCWANYGNGWTLNCGRNILVNCEAQESMGHGFEFTQGNGLECYGLISDRSGCSEGVFGTPTVKHSYGIKVTSSSGIVISGMITNFRDMESGFGISELGGIYCSNISDTNINLTVLNTMTNKYVAENSVYHNRVFINNKQMANTNTAIIPYVLTNGSIGEQIVNADGTFQLRNIYDALLNRYYQQLDNNGTYVARTNIIKADGGVIYGTYGKTTGFFGSDGTTRQSISTTVTDLNSAITVINSLVSILKGYGLIG